MANLKKLITLILFVALASTLLKGQNVGINNNNPQAALDVQGDVRYRSTNISLSAGYNGELDAISTKASVYNLNAAATITGIAGGIDGRVLTIVNTAAISLIRIKLIDEGDPLSTAISSNKLSLGNTFYINVNGSIVLRYDGFKQRWAVVSKTAVNDGNLATWQQAGNDIYNSNTGNVGIGTTSPNAKLDLNGDMVLRKGSIVLAPTGAFINTYSDVDIASNRFSFYDVTVPIGNCFITGFTGGIDGRTVTLYNTTANGITLLEKTVSAAANQLFTGTGSLTLNGYCSITFRYMSSDNYWHVIGSRNELGNNPWSSNGNNIYNTNSGNLGIGTNTPGQKLEVAGITKTDGFMMPTGAGSGKVLTSDANGLASWTPVVPPIVYYQHVIIGNKMWMTDNLDVDHYRNGDPIPQISDAAAWAAATTGAWCYYNNDPANEALYGKLYNWYAVADPRGLAPAGWHIPSWQDIAALATGPVGGKLKTTGTLEAGTGLWKTPNTDADNSTGFAGTPGGGRDYAGVFVNIGIDGTWWTTRADNPAMPYFFILVYYDGVLGWNYEPKAEGHSVRCLRD